MPPRRTPLVARTRLRRSALALGGSVVFRYSTLRPVSEKRQQENRERAKAVKALRRAGDCCARCGRPGGPGVTDGHEKRARSQGGDITRPDMLLCREVCNTWCEDNPELAAWQGWKESRKWPTAPCIAAGQCPPGSHGLGMHCSDKGEAA